MKCELCNEREAQVHITEGSGPTEKVRYLCEQCAEKSLYAKEQNKDNPFDIQTLLSMLAAHNRQAQNVTVEVPACPSCGSTIESVVNNGLFGCSYCYEFFGDHVPEIVRRVQLNQYRHAGKIPVQAEDSLRLKRDIQSLEKLLSEKIDTQAFEEAAVIRDRIQALKDGGQDE